MSCKEIYSHRLSFHLSKNQIFHFYLYYIIIKIILLFYKKIFLKIKKIKKIKNKYLLYYLLINNIKIRLYIYIYLYIYIIILNLPSTHCNKMIICQHIILIRTYCLEKVYISMLI